MNTLKLLLICGLALLLPQAGRAETSVVPPGVRAFVYHHINAEVEGHYGSEGVYSPYAMNERLGIDLIGKADAKAASVIQKLQESNPDLIKKLDLGTLALSPDIRVKADIFGMAFGVSKNFMLVGVVPVYQADVNFAGGFQSTKTFGQVANELEAQAAQLPASDRTEALALAQILRQLQAPTGEHAQGVLVNSMGYKPVGNWSGSGIGDLILYGQIKPIDGPKYKQGWKLGAEVPTGRPDDPDNLIDVPFGKGHFVSFVESLNDYYVFGDKWIVAGNIKYAYQWGHNPTMRLVPDGSVPLSSEKEQVYRKPGNILTSTAHSEVKLIGDLYFHSDYIYITREQDQVRGSRPDYDYAILEKNTQQNIHLGELGLQFTTVNLYLKGKFPAPFKLGTFMTRTLNAQNADKVDMATLRFEMYF